jgi:hypothetical protein
MDKKLDTEQKVFETLTGQYKHYCIEWDGMAIDENMPEFDSCLCYNKEQPQYIMRYK